ncbi:MAG: hypothetical protein M1830_008690 [Pleopsidium flavum]|nr:MAG: hypothetical protein M1830_008690 [Pleopsidium flavum]
MANPNSSRPLLNTYQAIVSTFSDFLTVAIHTILYERNIYPSTSFLSARKYNYPVRQNRHPKVCKWVQDAVAAVEAEILKGTVSRVSLIIYSPTSAPLERFLFDVSAFPHVPPSEALTLFEEPPGEPSLREQIEENEPRHSNTKVPVVDLEEQFRAIFARLAFCSSSLAPLPENCSFTLCIELKDEVGVDPPIGHPQPWIPAQPSLQPADKEQEAAVARDGGENGGGGGRRVKGSDLGGVRTTPVRSVEAGEFVIEMWIEEGKAKRELEDFGSTADPP